VTAASSTIYAKIEYLESEGFMTVYNGKKHLGFLLIEALIALAIIILALSMVYLAPAWMYKSASYAELEAAIFDIGFSYAEEIISRPKSALGLIASASNTTVAFTDSSSNTIRFNCAFVTAGRTIADAVTQVDFATFTIAPINQTTRIATLTFSALLRGG
jgi:Tfp pilus assembly protein PilV